MKMLIKYLKSCVFKGFYGDALAIPKGDCKQCQCNHDGTQETGFGPPVCDQLSGQCQCKIHVVGKNCDQCEDGFYNIISGEVSVHRNAERNIIQVGFERQCAE
jgi:coxsackievirus/adenovirus receptor